MIYTVLVLIVAVIAIVSLISHASSHNDIKKNHAEAVSQLKISSSLGPLKSEAFKRIYKKNLPPETPVYEAKGIVDYISITINGAENKEFTIADIRISGASYHKLRKKKVGIILDDYLPKSDEIKKALQTEFTESEIENINENSDIAEKFNIRSEELLEKHAYHTVKFVFLKEQSYEKQYAFIVGLDDWDIS